MSPFSPTMEFDQPHHLSPEVRALLTKYFKKALRGILAGIGNHYLFGQYLNYTTSFFLYFTYKSADVVRAVIRCFGRDGYSGRENSNLIDALMPFFGFVATTLALGEGSRAWAWFGDLGSGVLILWGVGLCVIPLVVWFFGASLRRWLRAAWKKYREFDQYVIKLKNDLIFGTCRRVWAALNSFDRSQIRVWRGMCVVWAKYRELDDHAQDLRARLIIWSFERVLDIWRWLAPFRIRIWAGLTVIRATIQPFLSGEDDAQGDQEPSDQFNRDGSFKHSKLKSERDIRLIKIPRKTLLGILGIKNPSDISGDSSDSLEFRMIHKSLDASPVYDAISYTWSDIHQTKDIRMNGRRFSVPENVFSILQHRSSYWATRYIWIDFLCINQKEDDEKTKQVQLMREIYSTATRVIVWLGDGRHSDLVPVFLDELIWIRLVNKQSIRSERIFRKYLNKRTEPKWLAFLDLLNQPWFERVWVIQELAFARKVDAVYGNRFIDWDVLIHIMHTFEFEGEKDAFRLLQSTDENSVSPPLPRSLQHAFMMEALREGVAQRQWRGIDGLLIHCRNFKATEPKDKVFALFGLAYPDSLGPLKIDYKKTVQEVYIETAQHLTQNEGIEILHMAGIGNPRGVPNLPSWVPDWSTTPQCQTLYDVGGINYHAAGDTRPMVSHLDDFKVQISGIKVDSIDLITTILETAPRNEGNESQNLSTQQRYLLWHDEALALCKKLPTSSYQGTTASPTEVFWRTIIGDKTSTQRPAPAIYGEYYLAWKESLRSKTSTLWSSSPATDSSSSTLDESQIEETLQSTRFHLVLNSCSGDRRFCVTRGGFMGLVPKDTQLGDEVFIFAGAQTPFVIRPGRGEEAEMYELVGEAYFCGMMDGEVWRGEVEVVTLR